MISKHRAVLTFALAALPLVESSATLAFTSSTTGLDQDRITQVAQRQRDFESSVQAQLLKVESERLAEARESAKTQLEIMQKARDQSFYIFLLLGTVASLLGAVSAIMSGLRERRQHSAYKEERDSFEKRAHANDVRNEELHAFAKRLAQSRTVSEEKHTDGLGQLLSIQQKNLEQINIITTAVANGASKNVQDMNATLAAFQRILEFKVQEAVDSQKELTKLSERISAMDLRERDQVRELLHEASGLRRPRHVYTRPDSALQRRMEEFARRFDLLSSDVIEHHCFSGATKLRDSFAELYLRRGIVAYYDNDPVKARTVLLRVSRDLPQEPKDLVDVDPKTAAFIEFYLALVEKNFGDPLEAARHIGRSYEFFGKNDPRELLTPTTRAEILSNGADLPAAQEALRGIIERTSHMHDLPAHDRACIARCFLMLGNTYYRQSEWAKAKEQYIEALVKGPTDSYYVLHSLAEVCEKQKQSVEAAQYRAKANTALLESRHLETKTALDTQVSLNSLAFLCNLGADQKRAMKHLAPRFG